MVDSPRSPFGGLPPCKPTEAERFQRIEGRIAGLEARLDAITALLNQQLDAIRVELQILKTK